MISLEIFKLSDISKEHSKEAKTGKVERNYKTFADQVFINQVSIFNDICE